MAYHLPTYLINKTRHAYLLLLVETLASVDMVRPHTFSHGENGTLNQA